MKENGVDHTVNDLLLTLAKWMNFEKWVQLREGDRRRTNSHQLLTKSGWKAEIASPLSQWHLWPITRRTTYCLYEEAGPNNIARLTSWRNQCGKVTGKTPFRSLCIPA